MKAVLKLAKKKSIILGLTVTLTFLVSCASVSTPINTSQAINEIPIPAYSSTPEVEKPTLVSSFTPTETLIPSATVLPSLTPTPKPTLQPIDFLDDSPFIPGIPIPDENNLLKAALENYLISMGLPAEQAEIKYRILRDDNNHMAIVALAMPAQAANPKYSDLYGPTPLLIAYPDDSNTDWQWDSLGLKDLAGLAGKKIGTTAPWMNDANVQTKQFLIREFNILIIENSFGWNRIEPTRGNIAPKRNSQIRNVIDFAAQNDMEVVGGPLLSWDDKPDWILNGQHTAEELEAMLREHVRLILLEYPEIKQWRIVNEFHSLKDGWHDDPIQRKFIEANENPDEILRIVYDEARKVRPDAVLILSDNANETTSKANYARNNQFSRWLKELELLDVISMHMHLDGSKPPEKAQVATAMQSFKDIGVQVYIDELDIILKDVKGDDRFLKQAVVYKDVVSTLLETDAGDVILTWNYGDNQSWLENTGIGLGDRVSPINDPTMFGDAPLLQPKPAYYAVLQALYEHLTRKPQ